MEKRTEERETKLKGRKCVVRQYHYGQFGKQVCAEMPGTIVYAVHSCKSGALLGYVIDHGMPSVHACFAATEDIILAR